MADSLFDPGGAKPYDPSRSEPYGTVGQFENPFMQSTKALINEVPKAARPVDTPQSIFQGPNDSDYRRIKRDLITPQAPQLMDRYIPGTRNLSHIAATVNTALTDAYGRNATAYNQAIGDVTGRLSDMERQRQALRSNEWNTYTHTVGNVANSGALAGSYAYQTQANMLEEELRRRTEAAKEHAAAVQNAFNKRSEALSASTGRTVLPPAVSYDSAGNLRIEYPELPGAQNTSGTTAPQGTSAPNASNEVIKAHGPLTMAETPEMAQSMEARARMEANPIQTLINPQADEPPTMKLVRAKTLNALAAAIDENARVDQPWFAAAKTPPPNLTATLGTDGSVNLDTLRKLISYDTPTQRNRFQRWYLRTFGPAFQDGTDWDQVYRFGTPSSRGGASRWYFALPEVEKAFQEKLQAANLPAVSLRALLSATNAIPTEASEIEYDANKRAAIAQRQVADYISAGGGTRPPPVPTPAVPTASPVLPNDMSTADLLERAANMRQQQRDFAYRKSRNMPYDAGAAAALGLQQRNLNSQLASARLAVENARRINRMATLARP